MRAKYLVVVEKGEHNSSAYSPDVPGCIATGRTIEETLARIRDALEFHLAGMAEHGESIPEPRSLNFYLNETDEISSDDIIAHVEVALPESVTA